MTGKIKWERAKKFKDMEVKYETGTELRSGKVVINAPPDDLARRARKAEQQWRKKNKLTEKLEKR